MIGDLGGTIDLSGAGVLAGRPALTLLAVRGSVLPTAAVTAPMVGTVRVRRDLAGDLTISGADVPADKPSLRVLAVGGTVRDSLIRVGGNIGAVVAAGFEDSRLFAGYDGPDNGVGGTFNFPAVVGTVRVTGRTSAFANSYLVATTFRNVALRSINPDNLGTPFGVFADERVGRLTVGLPSRLVYPGTDEQGDFRVGVV